MTIQRVDNQIIITLPASIDLEGVQRLINYLLYKEATKDSKAKQEDVTNWPARPISNGGKKINIAFYRSEIRR